MKIVSRAVKGSNRLAKLRQELSREARQRLKWFDYYNTHSHNARLTCRYFGITPQTFYRWKKRYDPAHLDSLEAHSRRPKHVRKPTWTVTEVKVVLALREEYPRWGKDKLALLLKERGYTLSVSMVGRILSYVKRRGILKEPVSNYVSTGKRQKNRPYATRKPKDYQARQEGGIVELDTLDIRPLPGVVLKHFTAHDVVSKWNVLGVYTRASATTAAGFLDTLMRRMPFPVKAIQVDGGSEFQAVFEELCRQRCIKLFVLPHRSPKLNGGVERAHRTHTEEFYEVTDSTFEIADLNKGLSECERVYNTVRPHQALAYLTPLEFLEKQRKEVRCH